MDKISLTHNFVRKYSKKECQTILGVSVNEFNKWLGFLDVIEPIAEKGTTGKGRPAHIFSTFNLYIMGVFKYLKVSGFDRKTSAKMISAIDQDKIIELIEYATKIGVIEKLEKISAILQLLSRVGDTATKDLKKIIFEKTIDLRPEAGIYLGFLLNQSLTVQGPETCIPIIDTSTKDFWSNSFFHFDTIQKAFRDISTIHLVNVGIVVSDIRERSRYFLENEKYDDWLKKMVGEDLVTNLLSHTLNK